MTNEIKIKEGIAKEIHELNKAGQCTRGLGTFGCACPQCLKLMNESAIELFENTESCTSSTNQTL